ncbi:L,D-transpeptidase [Streptomyces sp. LaBMicrA B280]|uniref:L,D-transpeptidase n=1 Tax=Streptomyces sp. LaBMicrA B280 TaxID=3391001 RepID=UPI003BA67C35
MAARLPSWAWVSGLTVGATVAVVALAVQAEHGPHPTAASVKPSTSASAATHGSAKPKPPAGPPALPPDSGDGRRIVYSPAAKRLWLVDATGKEIKTFEVWPGTVTLPPGRYSIINRTQSKTGSDGVPIEHIMYVAMVDGVNIAFSNALDGASPPPAEGKKLGGIRMRKQDGAALWAFGDLGTKVAVVK